MRKRLFSMGATSILLLTLVGVQADPAPPPPTDLGVEMRDDGSILLTWTAPATGLQYAIYRNNARLDTTTNSSFVDPDPEPFAEYFVTSVEQGQESESSESVFVMSASSSGGRGDLVPPSVELPAAIDSLLDNPPPVCLAVGVSIKTNRPPFVFPGINHACLPPVFHPPIEH